MPFCPKCRYEYKEGFTVCSDCGVPLVDSLDEPEEELDLIESPEELAEAIENGELDTDTMESLQDTVRIIHEMPKVYVEPEKRAEEYKSGAVVLIGVGIVGAVALILMDLKVIPISLPSSTNILINVVMGVLFLVFIVLGISSLGSYKKLLSQVKTDNDISDSVLNMLMNQGIERYTADDDPEGSDETNYFKRVDIIRGLVDDNYPDIEDSLKEHLIEEAYNRMFS